MQKYNELRFNLAVERIREKCIKSPRSVRARVINSIVNKIGKSEKRESFEDVARSFSNAQRKKAIAPTKKEWDSIVQKESNVNRGVVDVICPVYRGYDETLRCIYSVLKAKTERPFEFIVINDKSPDPQITKVLKEVALKGCITYIENNENLGFLKSMNLGMALHPERDVVWLNSDTEVFDYWLDRILNIADKDKRVGTITPISNNATIASYPRQVSDNCGELELSDAELDRICGAMNAGSYVVAPTGVGFCMYVRRSVLDMVGTLDEAFNMGYGEENDLCQRINKRGYLNVITPSVFVRHYGSVSFKEAALGFCRENAVILKNKHPNYIEDVNKWMKRDELTTYRIKLDARRLYKKWRREHNNIKPQEVVLHISHNRGGGTSTFISDLIEKSEVCNIANFNLIPLGSFSCSLLRADIDCPNVLSINYAAGIEDLRALLIGLRVSKIHIHSFVDWGTNIFGVIQDLSQELGIPYIISLHDYHWCCSRINLLQETGGVCLNLLETDCFSCDRNVHGHSSYEIRRLSRDLFFGAKRIVAPCEDMAKRISSLYDGIDIDIIPHSVCSGIIRREPNRDILSVCVLGNISDPKGLLVLEKLCEYVEMQKLQVKISVIGRVARKVSGLAVLGEYSNYDVLNKKIKEAKPSLMFLSSICPETFSYTLSEMLQTGIPVAAFDIGAPSERLKKMGLLSNVIDVKLKDDPKGLLEALMAVSKMSHVKILDETQISPELYYQ